MDVRRDDRGYGPRGGYLSGCERLRAEGLNAIGTTLLFAANDCEHGRELWAFPALTSIPSSVG